MRSAQFVTSIEMCSFHWNSELKFSKWLKTFTCDLSRCWLSARLYIKHSTLISSPAQLQEVGYTFYILYSLGRGTC